MDLRSSLDYFMTSPEKGVMAAVLSGTVAKFVAMAVVSRNQRPFELVGRVSDLVSFPVKACKGRHHTQAMCTDVGLEHDGLADRHWTLIGEDGKHFNMRMAPRLALVESQSEGDLLRITAPGMEPLDLPKRPDLKTARIVDTVFYEMPTRAIDCGDHANEWFRRYLGGVKVRLITCRPELFVRNVTAMPRNWENTARRGDKTIFSFLTSYMLLTTASLKDLNSRLDRPVSMDNFRPNIVVDNDIPFDEDRWEEVRIGDKLSFHSVEPCLRCVITTVDPETAQKDKATEPLKTLRSYRCFAPYAKKGPTFGLYISNDTTGRIRVGDPVYAKRKPSL